MRVPSRSTAPSGPLQIPRRRRAGVSCRCRNLLRGRSRNISTAKLRTGCWLGLWQDHGLVFASAVGTLLDRHNVLREFRKITQAAGLGTDWVPREMRHTFVSLLSSNGTALEDIADLVGHRGTATTETVYRKVIVPELRRGAEVMDRLFI